MTFLTPLLKQGVIEKMSFLLVVLYLECYYSTPLFNLTILVLKIEDPNSQK